MTVLETVADDLRNQLTADRRSLMTKRSRRFAAALAAEWAIIAVTLIVASRAHHIGVWLVALVVIGRRQQAIGILYYGVLGMRSAWRSRLQAREPDPPITAGRCTAEVEASSRPTPITWRTNRLWTELMQRSFGFDVLACRCGRSGIGSMSIDHRLSPSRG